MRLSLVLLALTAVLVGSADARAAPEPPTGVETRPGDASVIVRWAPAVGAAGYKLYRSADGGPFEPVLSVAFRPAAYTDFAVTNGRVYRYRAASVGADGSESAPSAEAEARPRVLSDDEFLDLVARTSFDFFWAEANPTNGLVRDRSTASSAASIASVGFGLTAYGVAADRGWITRAQATARTKATLEFLWAAPQSTAADATGYKGFYYHFLDMTTGRRAGRSELSSIDTALLMGGVRYAGQYFGGASADEARIRALSDSLFDRVDWAWFAPRPPRVSLGWSPEGGFLPFDWVGYNEAMLLYLLALGSRTHPLPASAWAAWTVNYSFRSDYSALPYVSFPPLFGHQYSHVWVDFRGTRDAFMRTVGSDYFENSRRATLAQRAYTTANPRGFVGYDADGWGITASDYPSGYLARGAPPAVNDEGTLVPTGPGGSYPFTPTESLSSLRAFYIRYRTRLWGRYGFLDAINPSRDWVATDVIGIDQGPIVLMIENGRRDAVWNVSMRDSVLQRGLRRAGFQRITTSTDDAPAAEPPALTLAPNPAAAAAVATVTLVVAGSATLDAYDVLGRRVRSFDAGRLAPGTHRVPLDLAALAPGTYVLVLRAGGRAVTTPFVRLP